jgi:hypothetical protein
MIAALVAAALACEPPTFPPHLEVSVPKPGNAEFRVWHGDPAETKDLALEDAAGARIMTTTRSNAVPPTPPRPYGWSAAYTVIRPVKKLKPGTYTVRLGDRSASFEVRGKDRTAPAMPAGFAARVNGVHVVTGYDAACAETVDVRPMLELLFTAVPDAEVYELEWAGATGKKGTIPGLVVDGPGIAIPAVWFAESPGSVTVSLYAVDAAGNKSPPAVTTTVIPEL